MGLLWRFTRIRFTPLKASVVYCWHLPLTGRAGPFKSGLGEGWTRRGLSVIQILKIDVSVIETKKEFFFLGRLSVECE